MRKLIILVILLISFSLILKAEFDIEKFTDPAKYDWDSKENYLDAREKLRLKQNIIQLYEMKNSDLNSNLLKSAVLPGWGHFSVNKYTRGEILMGLELIFLGTAFYYYDQAMENYDKYKDSDYIGDINKYYDKAKKPYQYSQTFFALGIATWLYSIYDTVVVTREYNADLWQKLNEKYQDNETDPGISLYPLGIKWNFE